MYRLALPLSSSADVGRYAGQRYCKGGWRLFIRRVYSPFTAETHFTPWEARYRVPFTGAAVNFIFSNSADWIWIG